MCIRDSAIADRIKNLESNLKNKSSASAEINKELDEIKEILVTEKLTSVALEHREFRFNEKYQHTLLIRKLTGFFAIFGFIAFILGFYFWYIKVQRHLDKILVRKSSNESSDQ